jgi:uncharacterized membrane protein
VAAAAGWLITGCAVDLGTLEEGQPAGASAINDVGVIVGSGDVAGPPHAFRKFPGGPMVDLNSDPNAQSQANGVNNAGVAVGASVDPESAAVLWELDGTMVDLGVGPNSVAHDINDSGTIVGGSGADAFVRAPSGEVTILPRGHFAWQRALGVNEDGVVVGYGATEFGDQRPIVWSPPSYAHSILPVEQGEDGAAWEVNNSGDVVGWAGPQSERPVLWRAGSHEKVELASGPYAGGIATAVNDSGQIVGKMTKAGSADEVAVRWDSAGASPVSLGGLGGGWAVATDINEAGDAVGAARVPGNPPGQWVSHAVLYPHDD